MQGFVDVKKRASSASLGQTYGRSTREGLCKAMFTNSEANVNDDLAEELAEVKAVLEEKDMQLQESRTEVDELKLELKCIKVNAELIH